MISAQEAKEKAVQCNTDKTADLIAHVEQQVNKAVQEGSFTATIYKTLPDAVQEHLIGLGYVITKQQVDYNEAGYIIRW